MRKIYNLFFLGLIFACILFFVFPVENIWAADKTELEGEWVSTVPGQDMVFTFSAENFSIKSPNVPNYWYKGTFKLNTKVNPKQVELAIKEGGIPQYVDKKSLGVYTISEGILILALNQPGKADYPTSLKGDSGSLVFKLKKK